MNSSATPFFSIPHITLFQSLSRTSCLTHMCPLFPKSLVPSRVCVVRRLHQPLFKIRLSGLYVLVLPTLQEYIAFSTWNPLEITVVERSCSVPSSLHPRLGNHAKTERVVCFRKESRARLHALYAAWSVVLKRIGLRHP
jgi:hypothetical protein